MTTFHQELSHSGRPRHNDQQAHISTLPGSCWVDLWTNLIQRLGQTRKSQKRTILHSYHTYSSQHICFGTFRYTRGPIAIERIMHDFSFIFVCLANYGQKAVNHPSRSKCEKFALTAANSTLIQQIHNIVLKNSLNIRHCTATERNIQYESYLLV